MRRVSFIDDQGRDIVFSQGIGGDDGPWGLFRVKPSGSLQRIKSVPMCGNKAKALEMAAAYAHKKEWRLA